MSGVVGIVNIDGSPIDRELLARMTEFIAYRGPDAQEVWYGVHVGFGHTMLRTTDEARNERQPLTLDGVIWIVADCRVDARDDLIRQLRGVGAAVARETTDVELILRAYLAWDTDCVYRLLGDFAFAIWDARKQRLFCARDHFGVKPFFYAHVGNALVFGNTLECLRLHPAVSDKLNEIAIADFLLFGMNQDAATTTFADIRRLPGAHRLECSDGAVRARRYWSLPTDGEIRYGRAEEYVQHFSELLETSVHDRLRTDRVACEMSGGLDSTSVVATAAGIRAQHDRVLDIRAFTVVYDRLLPDRERHYAGLAAKHLDVPIEFLAADDYPLFDGVDRSAWRRPEPFNVYPFASVESASLAMMAAHSRVALTGWDGDALMCESPKHHLRALLADGDFRRLIGDVAWYVGMKRALPPVGFRTWLKRKLGTYPVRSVYPSWAEPSFASRVDLRGRWERVNAERKPEHPLRPRAYAMLSNANWWSLFEGYDPGVTRLPIEARHPLKDLRLVEYVLAIPPLPWSVDKHILRTAMKHVLPEPILARPKTSLAGDPAVERLRESNHFRLDEFEPADGLRRYVDRDAVPRVAGETDPERLWLNLGPYALDRWLATSLEAPRGEEFRARMASTHESPAQSCAPRRCRPRRGL